MTKAGSIVHIPLNQVRPFANQPRKDFDQKALQELADAIGEVGQQLSALVVKLPKGHEHKYELVDGERRWRACRIAKIETLKCEIVETADEADQYRRSLASNFGKADHTPLEISEAIKVLREDGMTLKQIANLFGKSEPWVQNYQKLQELSEPVAKLLSHPNKAQRLRVSHAFAIAQLPKGKQLEVARECIDGAMTPYQVYQRVRNKKVELGIAKPEDRDSHDDWRVLFGFFNRTSGDLKTLMEWDEKWLQRVLDGRSADQLERLDHLVENMSGEFMAHAEFVQLLIQRSRNKRRRETA